MATKKNRLIERARQSVRKPKPPRLVEPNTQRKGYRVVAVSLYTPEAEWVDKTWRELDRVGRSKMIKVNRSLVVREAILRLQEDLGDKTPEEVLRDFTEHQAQRS